LDGLRQIETYQKAMLAASGLVTRIALSPPLIETILFNPSICT
jgi:hypothetical protein